MMDIEDIIISTEDCIPPKNSCEFVEGNATKDIEIDKNIKFCEIRTDIEVRKLRTVRLWGQVKDCDGNPIRCALVKLVKEVKKGTKVEFQGIAHGITDCLGFYQFDICIPESNEKNKYRVIASKPALGEELSIETSACNPCKDPCQCAK